jgi:hypothetical protein
MEPSRAVPILGLVVNILEHQFWWRVGFVPPKGYHNAKTIWRDRSPCLSGMQTLHALDAAHAAPARVLIETEGQWIDDFIKRLNHAVENMVRKK